MCPALCLAEALNLSLIDPGTKVLVHGDYPTGTTRVVHHCHKSYVEATVCLLYMSSQPNAASRKCMYRQLLHSLIDFDQGGTI
jgi:hypothetical protein